ncbi:MAG: OmpA family protein [Spirochaetes bacterium]|jgi:outer membrane protein OmpA-like peptidoglycan-associated protein|nr:OmpA family protein [Spirochaetota bacterium]
MFLKIIALLIVFNLTILSAGVYEVPGHSEESYLADATILRLKMAKEPENPEHHRLLIMFLMSVEEFESAARECSIYLATGHGSKKENREIEYTRIIALASSSRYKEAIERTALYLKKYKHSDEDREFLNRKRRLYSRALKTKGAVSGLKIIAENESALGVDASNGTVITYNRLLNKIGFRYLADGKVALPVLLPPDTDSESLISITISKNGKRALASFRDGDGAVIAESRYDSGWSEWSFDSELNRGSVNAYPCFIQGVTTLFFVTNRVEGNGLDIYYSEYSRDGWQKARPVEGVNSSGDEASVYVPLDGNQLFFSSNGRPGLGGIDIYTGKLELKPVPTVTVERNVVSVNTFRNEITPPYFTTELPFYTVTHVNADRSYLYGADSLWTETGKTVVKKVEKPAVKIPESGTLVAHDLQFDTGSAYIRPSSYRFLEQLALYMKNNPSKGIIINGHTDSVGTEEVNRRLSLNRARAVARYLIRNGIAADRIRTNGLGTSENIESNDTEEGRQKNRRVEISFFDLGA